MLLSKPALFGRAMLALSVSGLIAHTRVYASEGDFYAKGTAYRAATYKAGAGDPDHPNWNPWGKTDPLWVVDINANADADAGDLNRPVYAPETGFVKQVSWATSGSDWGNSIVWSSANGLEEFHVAHLNQVIKTGPVNGGDLIANAGNTGKINSKVSPDFGAHLHISRLLNKQPAPVILSGVQLLPSYEYPGNPYTSKGQVTANVSAPSTLPAPSLNFPSDAQTSVSTTPSFSWTSVSGANRYWLMVTTNPADFPTDTKATGCPGCVSTGLSGNTDSNSFTAGSMFTHNGTSRILNPGTTYYWKVQAWNTDGAQGNYAIASSFTTAGQNSITLNQAQSVSPTFNGSTRETASGISCGTVVPGRLEVKEDQNYFRFTPQQHANYVVYTRGSTDTWGELYDEQFKRLAHDYDSGGDRNFRIAHSLVAGKTYYVLVRGYPGPYSLHIDGP